MKFALITERKNPPDRRVVLSPEACQKVIHDFPDVEIVVESSDVRVFPDEAYRELGIPVSDDVSDADIFLGVKEVPVDALVPDKSYFFFSHTIKKQPYNRKLLQAILKKRINLFDHETIVDETGKRLIGFGYYAGLVGAFNGIRAYGIRFNEFHLPKASDLRNKSEMFEIIQTVKLPPIKIVLTGTGRVGSGAKEVLDHMGIREVSVDEYLNEVFNEAVYVNVDVLDYNARNDGQSLDIYDFFTNPGEYHSTFSRFAAVSDLFIAGHFFGEGAPFLLTDENLRDPNCKIKVIADISCDIGGPVASTIRSSTIEDPLYGYDPVTESEVDFMQDGAITVMAVDNLPCELPDNASRGFGFQFIENVMPAFFNDDEHQILERARITEHGHLTKRFSYLQDYVDGLE